MEHVGAATSKVPPSWNPADARYPFTVWRQDLELWLIGTDLEEGKRAGAIALQLHGEAREIARQMDPNRLKNGIAAVAATENVPATEAVPGWRCLLNELETRLGPQRQSKALQSLENFFHFARKPQENIDSLLSRYSMMYQQASVDGQLTLSYSGRAYKLLELVGLKSQELLVVLGPWNGELPNTADDYSKFLEHIRRHQQRVEQQYRGKSLLSWQDETDDGTWWYEDDAWWDDDPYWQWSEWDGEYHPEDPTETEGAQTTAGAADEEAEAYYSEEQYWDEMAYLWKPWRAKGKGKGYQFGKNKGKGKAYPGKSPGKSFFKGKSQGKKSQKSNPKGKDGQPLRCSICGSATHLRAQCPKQQAQASSTSASTPPQTFSTWTLLGEKPCGEPTASYLSMEPRLGRHEALLIDTGAVGNLTGADWISRAKNVSRTSSNSGALLHGVGGAGTGIMGRAEVPLRLHSSDGSVENIKFSTTVGEQKDIPALLGL
eukprot:6492279-Amphidinium_carterae.1